MGWVISGFSMYLEVDGKISKDSSHFKHNTCTSSNSAWTAAPSLELYGQLMFKEHSDCPLFHAGMQLDWMYIHVGSLSKRTS
jgi:hypothetical protein